MNDFSNAFKRLSELMVLLMSERFPSGLSISEISSSLKVPQDVVIKDILSLTEDEHIRCSIVLSDDITVDSWRRSLKKYDPSALRQPVRIDPDFFLPEFSDDVVAVRLSPFEKSVFARAANVSRFSDSVWIKKPVFTGGEEQPVILGPLQMAIEQGHPVTFTYTTEAGEDKADRFIPRSIYSDLFNKKLYLAGMQELLKSDYGTEERQAGQGNVSLVLIRIDRIRNLKVYEDETVQPLKKGELVMLDHIWGGDISSEEIAKGIKHVKVRISQDTGNMYEKIKTETNGRRFRKLYDDPEKEGIAYYEDDICGFAAFKRWLLGYGASLMVLEPAELTEEIYGNLLNRVERYRDFDLTVKNYEPLL